MGGYPKILLFCCKDFVNRYILFTFAPRYDILTVRKFVVYLRGWFRSSAG